MKLSVIEVDDAGVSFAIDDDMSGIEFTMDNTKTVYSDQLIHDFIPTDKGRQQKHIMIS